MEQIRKGSSLHRSGHTGEVSADSGLDQSFHPFPDGQLLVMAEVMGLVRVVHELETVSSGVYVLIGHDLVPNDVDIPLDLGLLQAQRVIKPFLSAKAFTLTDLSLLFRIYKCGPLSTKYLCLHELNWSFFLRIHPLWSGVPICSNTLLPGFISGAPATCAATAGDRATTSDVELVRFRSTAGSRDDFSLSDGVGRGFSLSFSDSDTGRRVFSLSLSAMPSEVDGRLRPLGWRIREKVLCMSDSWSPFSFSGFSLFSELPFVSENVTPLDQGHNSHRQLGNRLPPLPKRTRKAAAEEAETIRVLALIAALLLARPPSRRREIGVVRLARIIRRRRCELLGVSAA